MSPNGDACWYINADGAVSEITDGDVTHIYKYDSLGRLIRAFQKDSSGNVTMAATGSLDTSNGTVTSYGYALVGLLSWGEVLTNYIGTAITYGTWSKVLSATGTMLRLCVLISIKFIC